MVLQDLLDPQVLRVIRVFKVHKVSRYTSATGPQGNQGVGCYSTCVSRCSGSTVLWSTGGTGPTDHKVLMETVVLLLTIHSALRRLRKTWSGTLRFSEGTFSGALTLYIDDADDNGTIYKHLRTLMTLPLQLKVIIEFPIV